MLNKRSAVVGADGAGSSGAAASSGSAGRVSAKGADASKSKSNASATTGGPVNFIERCVQVDVVGGQDAAAYAGLKMELQVALSAAARH